MLVPNRLIFPFLLHPFGSHVGARPRIRAAFGWMQDIYHGNTLMQRNHGALTRRLQNLGASVSACKNLHLGPDLAPLVRSSAGALSSLRLGTPVSGSPETRLLTPGPRPHPPTPSPRGGFSPFLPPSPLIFPFSPTTFTSNRTDLPRGPMFGSHAETPDPQIEYGEGRGRC